MTIQETAEIKGRKIIVTTYGKRGSAVFPASHIAFGIKEAREIVAKLGDRTDLKEPTAARVAALRSGIEQWEGMKR